ncbi:MAG: hypothetical protein L0Y76_00925 [Ignavibacteria bacterium]|nr:hypothetical protein [Ignavibacteria bacterium]
MPPMIEIFKYFRKSETKKILPVKFRYIKRKKIVTFVPLSHADKLTFDLAYAGAGRIGNYRVCSFRMKGVGTFVPGKGSNPFAGRKGKLAFEEEVRLEMEFSADITDKIIDALMESHPYEEPAYEIYDFEKRSKTADTYFIELRKKTGLGDLMRMLNGKISSGTKISGKGYSKILFTLRKIDKEITETAKEYKSELVISPEKTKTNIKII